MVVPGKLVNVALFVWNPPSIHWYSKTPFKSVFETKRISAYYLKNYFTKNLGIFFFRLRFSQRNKKKEEKELKIIEAIKKREAAKLKSGDAPKEIAIS